MTPEEKKQFMEQAKALYLKKVKLKSNLISIARKARSRGDKKTLDKVTDTLRKLI